jgi:hypothetical protein
MVNARLFILIVSISLISACGGESKSLSQVLKSSPNRLLFAASGSCYGGGVALSTPSQTIVAYDIESGAFHHTVIDYAIYSPGDSPVAMTEFDKDRMLVLVENTAGRRIDLIRKDGTAVETYLTNTTALSAVLRSIAYQPDGTILASKSSAIEKFGANKARVTQGANPWVNAPGGSCATATTLISAIDVFDNGKILYTHAAATPNNEFGLISATGYATAGDCLASTAAPTTTALPTAITIHPSGKTLVAFGSTTAASNFIYSYDVNSTANSISGATAAYTDISVVNGPSAMTVDTANGYVYVANSISTFNTIEEFALNGSTLSRTRTLPFAGPSVFTKCISSLRVMSYDQ